MLIEANHPNCVACAARTPTSTGFVCEPWKFGQSNSKNKFILGRNHKSGTTLRPLLCPHPENTVSTQNSGQVMLRKMLNK